MYKLKELLNIKGIQRIWIYIRNIKILENVNTLLTLTKNGFFLGIGSYVCYLYYAISEKLTITVYEKAIEGKWLILGLGIVLLGCYIIPNYIKKKYIKIEEEKTINIEKKNIIEAKAGIINNSFSPLLALLSVVVPLLELTKSTAGNTTILGPIAITEKVDLEVKIQWLNEIRTKLSTIPEADWQGIMLAGIDLKNISNKNELLLIIQQNHVNYVEKIITQIQTASIKNSPSWSELIQAHPYITGGIVIGSIISIALLWYFWEDVVKLLQGIKASLTSSFDLHKEAFTMAKEFTGKISNMNDRMAVMGEEIAKLKIAVEGLKVQTNLEGVAIEHINTKIVGLVNGLKTAMSEITSVTEKIQGVLSKEVTIGLGRSIKENLMIIYDIYAGQQKSYSVLLSILEQGANHANDKAVLETLAELLADINKGVPGLALQASISKLEVLLAGLEKKV